VNIYRVAFIGHREISNIMKVEDMLEELIRNLIREKEFVEFYVGRNGDFDISAASCIKRVQKTLGHANSSLILTLPYPVKDIEYYEKFYDEIIIPVSTHFKAAITVRNKWMVDNADLLIAYVEENKTGGALSALKYAKKQEVQIINLAAKV